MLLKTCSETTTMGKESLPLRSQPKITVGLVDQKERISGRLDGNFRAEAFGTLSGPFSAEAEAEAVLLFDERREPIVRLPTIRLSAQEGSSFCLFNITIGHDFHWERKEDQRFRGDLILKARGDGTIVAINELPCEDYLTSVITSEMNASAPTEFLKAHAILSRSWLLAGLEKHDTSKETEKTSDDEVIRWYGRQEHDLFDVCADDHCQRYQGITRILSREAEEAVRQTHGLVLIYRGEICDARYSKACGGRTEEFSTAWEDRDISYLVSISDASIPHRPVQSEQEASSWVLSEPQAFCNTRDEGLLRTILTDFDGETENFFRWRTEYSREELQEILRERSGLDLGLPRDFIALRRGPSGRISRLKIVGSKGTVIVGKELEIRRWLSRSHLQSSAFIVTFQGDRVIFRGAGWGHGVGLCQIGAAVMATRGCSAEHILKHYFKGVEIKKIY